MTQDEQETKLILQLQAGDEHALEELYALLHRHVYALALTMLKSKEDAEEVLQDTFVITNRKAHLFNPQRGSARAYIYTIARNLAKMRLRAKGSRPAYTTEALIDDHPALATHKHDKRDQILIRTALNHLKQEDRHLLEASFYKGYSHSELAEATGLALGTVKSRIRRALKKLRDLLGDA